MKNPRLLFLCFLYPALGNTWLCNVLFFKPVKKTLTGTWKDSPVLGSAPNRALVLCQGKGGIFFSVSQFLCFYFPLSYALIDCLSISLSLSSSVACGCWCIVSLGTVTPYDSSVSDVMPSNGGSLILRCWTATAECLTMFDWWAPSAVFALCILLGVKFHLGVINHIRKNWNLLEGDEFGFWLFFMNQDITQEQT